MHGLFVTGTGTGVGKTVCAAAIIAALTARGNNVRAFKPAVTGLAESSDAEWPHDHVALAEATPSQRAEEVAPYLFDPAVSPHLAAELAGTTIDPKAIRRRAVEQSTAGDLMVCEGVGGLLTPLTYDYSVLDLAVDLALPVVVVGHAGLGTISDTRLTVDAARNARLFVAGVVLNRWPAEPDTIQRSNRTTLERVCGLPVATLPSIARADLATAGAALPLDDWLLPRHTIDDPGGPTPCGAGRQGPVQQ